VKYRQLTLATTDSDIYHQLFHYLQQFDRVVCCRLLLERVDSKSHRHTVGRDWNHVRGPSRG